MDEIRVLLVEDDKSLALDIEMMIDELEYKYLGNPTSSNEALHAITEKKPDLIIMDIGIEGEKNGIEVATEIAHLNIPLIFITAFQNEEYFKAAKEVSPAAFLIKPFNMLTLQNTIELAVMKLQQSKQEDESMWRDNISPQGTVFIKMNKTLRKVYVKDICWIEVSGNYSYLHTKQNKYILKMSLTNILKSVEPHADFIRVHKQFVVQTRYIDSVKVSDNIMSVAGQEIPIGRRFKKDLLDKLQYL